jgi:hypothetical protein
LKCVTVPDLRCIEVAHGTTGSGGRGTTGTQHYVDKQHWFCTLKCVTVPDLRCIEVAHGTTGSGGGVCGG